MQTFDPNNTFNFSKLHLATPQPIQGGAYITKISVIDPESTPLYVQFPKCTTKQGIIQNKRGTYTDLLYLVGSNEILQEWISNLEITCQHIINSKKDQWFHNDLSQDDIEHMMSPISRIYKSGQQVLIRCTINQCMVYDEKLQRKNLDDITNTNTIIPLVCIEGIRFTAKSFEFDIKLVQSMILDPEPDINDVCLIKHSGISNSLGDLKNIPQENTSVENVTDRNNHIPSVLSAQPIKTETPQQPVEAPSPPPVEESPVGASPIEASSVEASSVEASPVEASPVEESPVEESQTLPVAQESVEPHVEPHVESHVEVQSPLPVEAPSSPSKNTESKESNQDSKIPDIMEVDLEIDDDSSDNDIQLRNPNEIYYEIYRAAREKAKHMRRVAIEALLEAKQIKTKYMLDDIDDSSDEEEQL